MSRTTTWHITCDLCGEHESHPEPLTPEEAAGRGWHVGPDGDDLCDDCATPEGDPR